MRDKLEHFVIYKCRGNFRIKNKIKERMRCKHTHTHLSMSKYSYKDCEKLIDYIINCRVPYDSYLRDSAIRLSRNERYITNIEVKKQKDKDRQRYINKPSYVKC